MEITVRATSDLAELMPASGKVIIDHPASVGDLLSLLGINPEAIMLIVINKQIGDIDTLLTDGAIVELIPPISGG
ncbi:MAG: MoaD/ThiS family protein [bacterium]